MDYRRIIFNCLWIIIVFNTVSQGCVFYSRNGYDSESDGVRFIRVREDLLLGGEVLNLRAYPRNSIKLRGMERSSDHNYFRLNEINSTNVQVLLDKSLEDLVDRDIPQNLLKFKVQCNNVNGRVEETSFMTVTVYVEDINDHYPKFMGAPYNVYVDESTAIGTTIFSGISAFDRDKPNTPNSDVQFSLGSQDYPGGPYFALESPHRPSIVLRRKLDYDEGIRVFEISVIAGDRGTPQKLSNTTAKIFVKDSDDLPPKFTEGVYRTKINEFSPLTGKPIRIPLVFKPQIEARDQDSLNATLYYDLISGNERKLFWANPTTGMVFLDKEIDLEEEDLPGNTFVMQMEARQADSPLKRALARIEVEVMDLNDNVPEFDVDLYNISIVENLPNGFSVLQVNAVDRDQGENADFYYQIFDEKPQGAFTIDTRSGWLTVQDQSLLDRESRKSITMKVKAIEKVGSYHPRDESSGKVSVEITLLDSNDNTPEFEMGNLYEFKVNINAKIGHTVGHVKANDPDAGRNGMIMYELQRPRASGIIPFKLDNKTGALTVSGPLNIGRIALFVEASDQPVNPSERRFSLAVVTIEIVRHKTDIMMDFIGAPYEFWVGSDVGVGTSVGQIRTTVDYDMQGSVMYDLLHSYPEGVPFAVEERSGTVTVIRKLEEFNRKLYDFEAVAAHESFVNRHRNDKSFGQLVRRTSKSQKQKIHSGEVIEIEEGSAATLSHNMLVTNVTIHVVNRDEERGILMRGTGGDPIEFHVKENAVGALIGQLLYTNKTNAIKKELSKEIVPQTRGSDPKTIISKRMGRQMSSTRFNRNVVKFNEIPHYYPRRRLRDSNSETSFYVSVTPSVFFDDGMMDVTPRPPMPSRRTRFVEETESRSINYFESKIEGDQPSQDQTVLFEDYETSKVVKNREKRSRVSSTFSRRYDPTTNDSFVALPRGGRPYTTSEPFLPTIQRTRTRPPNLTNPTTPTVPISIASALTQSQTPHNNQSTYSHHHHHARKDFEPHRGLRFLIANQQDVTDMISITNEGILMTVKGLDREVRDVYRLTIIAEYSKGFVSGAGIYQVTVFVDDENDNAPTFNQNSFIGMIAENSPVGTKILLNQPIVVKDNDIGENAEFSLTLFGEGSNLFTLELVNRTEKRTSKQIELPFDIFNNKSLGGMEKSFATLQMMFMESMNSIDVGPHYAIKFNGPNGLDREREGFYNLRLVARDKGGLKSEVKLGIYIADVNDNPPMFDKIAVFKNVGVEVLESANDMEIYFVDHVDIIPNIIHEKPKLQQMKLETSTPSGFSLHKDRIKEMVEHINVGIGSPRSFNSTRADRRRSLHTKKSDTLSRQVRRDSPIPMFSIKENVQVGQSILKVTATDDDYEGNAQVYYEIVSENHVSTRAANHKMPVMNFFSIDRISGEIKINRPLPAESEIKLNISARDIGGLSDHTVIRFKVIDVNDHPPVFEKSWYTFDLDEGSYFKHAIGQTLATDEDYGQNADITYSIQSKDKIPFTINPHEGTLAVTGELDREKFVRYEFKVMAADNGSSNSNLHTTVEVEVNILDVNDNAPEFTGYDEIYQDGRVVATQSRKLTNFNYYESIDDNYELDGTSEKMPIYRAYLNRNTEPGTLVKHVTAIDRDFPGNGNGLVMYALNQKKLPYMFEIDSREGIITTVSKLNKYRGYEHINLTVIASDLGSPSMSSSALVLINLQGEEMYDDDEIDMDGNTFKHKYYELEVMENNPTPMVILKINTTTPDESYRWNIINENDALRNEEFKIDPMNGTLWLVKSLDREEKDVYRLKIRAEKVGREGRELPELMYPVVGSRLNGLSENEVRIIVRVQDDNDNEPTFKGNGRPIIAVIPNTANFGYPVTTVEAEDNDIGINADIRYTLLNEPSRLFEIDAITGRIRVIGMISQESQKVYGFDVKATDREGRDDGRSTISNVFVYVLDENRQVRIVLSGLPVEVEKGVDSLTKVLSDATGLDVRVRILEPHIGDNEPATDIYLYAVDPKTNSVVDMEDLQAMMASVDMGNIYPPLPIIELPQLGGPRTFAKSHGVQYGTLTGSELASIILAVAIFAGGLATTLCIVCVRYKRHKRLSSTHSATSGLAYSLSKTPSSLHTVTSKSTTNSGLNLSFASSRPRLYSDNFSSRNSYRDHEREYIDVPLPQSVLNPFNTHEHEPTCLRFNQLRNPSSTMIDTSATSLHSSCRDSGLEMGIDGRQQKNIEKVNSEWLLWNKERDLNSQRNKCICGQDRKKNGGDDSSDSYEDSLKNSPINRRTSLPRNTGSRRPPRHQSAEGDSTGRRRSGSRGVRHSFSGVRDDAVTQALPNITNRTNFIGARNSMTDLEERLRNLGITFHEPFILNNSRC